MAMSDPLGNMFTIIRNGQQARLSKVTVPASKLRARVLDVLQDEGYIRGYSEAVDSAGHKVFTVELKYHEGKAVIQELKRVSKPGRRVYSRSQSIPHIHNGLGVAIVSTPHGVMADYKARAENVGGEVLGQVF